MAGGGNSAANTWTTAPTFCPPQYTRVFDGESGRIYTCDYMGAISVVIDGDLFARTWWNFGGDTATEFSDNAKATLGTWNPKFDDDYARWLAAQMPSVPPGPDGGQ